MFQYRVADDTVAMTLLEEKPESIAELFQACYRRQFTGNMTLHFRGGRPWCVDFGHPVRVTFDDDPKRQK